jgi:hypothetical protein
MRPAKLALVWAGAAFIALTVLVRIARGEVVILSGYAAPVVRLVAIVLVFLASCADKLRPGEPTGQPDEKPADLSQGTAPGGTPADPSQGTAPADLSQGTAPVAAPAEPEPVATVEPGPVKQEFPARVTDATLSVTFNWIEPRGLWLQVSAGHIVDPTWGMRGRLLDADTQARMQAMITAFEGFFARQKKGEKETAATLRGLLATAEAVPLYDAWLPGFLWGYARTIKPAPVDLLAHIERHLRVAHALVLGQATTGPLEFSAWRSKAGPPPGWRGAIVPKGLAAAARKEFEAGADAGQWETAAVLPLTVGLGSVALIRRAGETNIAAGAALRLRRLDVIRAANGATLRHASLGELVLPPGAEVTAWNVGEFLAPAGRTQVQAWIDAALGGDAAALTKLEAVLPAAHAAMRASVQARADAPGAASLRTLLTAFDE